MRNVGMLSVLLVVAVMSTVVSAEEPTPTNPPEAETTTSNVDQLIEQLNADRFSQRQQATKQLVNAGPDAIPQLVKAAQIGPAEITARVVEILEQHANSGDEDTASKAKTALENIAASSDPTVARFAKKALGLAVPKKSEADPAPQPNPARMPNPPIRIRNGQIQMQFQFNGNGGRKITQTNINGVKNTTVEEDGKKVVVQEEANGGIKLSLTEDDDEGQPKTTEYEADNLDDLKKKHPEAHRLYKKYAGKNAALPFQIRQVPGLQPFQPKAAAEAQRLKILLQQLKTINLENIDEETRDSLQKQLDEIQGQLKPSP